MNTIGTIGVAIVLRVFGVVAIAEGKTARLRMA